MAVRGIRGATTVATDSSEAILAVTSELLEAIVAANRVAIDDIASIIFTVTPDLKSEYPARAARLLGWSNLALIGATEMDLPGGLRPRPRPSSGRNRWRRGSPGTISGAGAVEPAIGNSAATAYP